MTPLESSKRLLRKSFNTLNLLAMNELERYYQDYWLSYNGETELQGLTPFGFNGNAPLNISSFDKTQLDWALDFAQACGEPIRTINKNHTSYGLKHLAERQAKKLSNNEVNYITNGALILAMVDAGFRFVRDGDSPNVFFNVSERTLKKIYKAWNNI